jgi:hypothetical protein
MDQQVQWTCERARGHRSRCLRGEAVDQFLGYSILQCTISCLRLGIADSILVQMPFYCNRFHLNRWHSKHARRDFGIPFSYFLFSHFLFPCRGFYFWFAICWLPSAGSLFSSSRVRVSCVPIRGFQFPPDSHFPFPISHFPFPISHFPFPVCQFPIPNSQF